MGDVRALENHRFRRELVQVRRMDLYASVTSQRICALLVRQKQYQVWLSWCGHELRVRSKSAVAIDCNDSTVTVAVRATRTLPGKFRVATFIHPVFHHPDETLFDSARFRRVTRYDSAGHDEF
jgi:hypothetical protein